MSKTDIEWYFQSVQTLPGVGPKSFELCDRLFGGTFKNLLFHVPVAYIDREYSPPLSGVNAGEVITVRVTIEQHISPPKHSRVPYKIIASNHTGQIFLTFFGKYTAYLRQKFPENMDVIISGKAEVFAGKVQMSHPDYMVPLHKVGEITSVEPVYSLTKGLSSKILGSMVNEVLNRMPQLREWHRGDFLDSQQWPDFSQALKQVHQPKHKHDISEQNSARKRLIFDEFLAHQLALALSRDKVKKQQGQALKITGEMQKSLETSLPFSLTAGQKAVIADVLADMTSEHKMVRLLQGDVGSGKTMVALMTMIAAVEAGKQAALMAPTEILAVQHAVSIEAYIQQAGLSDVIQVTLFTGKDKGKKRAQTLESLESGQCQIAIGTHTLFQEKVVFKDLGLVVIDEQHRFGVKQRLALVDKGENVDLLLMSATPIPRTLTLTLYGDMEISILSEKPVGRQTIDTRIMPQTKLPSLMQGLGRPVSSGEKVYWVCPLVEENEESELIAAEERYAALRKIYGPKVGIVHGKMSAEDKDSVMMEFKAGAIDILVATTVIEVGVDVPEATVIIIEQAERFGLSQLHQLRGRVGRGKLRSSCVLVYGNGLSETGKRRLDIMRQSDDGFVIAEEDLVIRGEGDVIGTAQSGMPKFKMGQLPEDRELLFLARDHVKQILQSPEQIPSYHPLLMLFDFEGSMELLHA